MPCRKTMFSPKPIQPIYQKIKKNIRLFRVPNLKKGLGALGIPIPNSGDTYDKSSPQSFFVRRYVAITVSVPTGLKLKRQRKFRIDNHVSTVTSTDRFENLTKIEQFNWLIEEYLPCVITPYIHAGIIVPELTAKYNVHLHILAYDPSIQSESELDDFRKMVGSTLGVKKIIKSEANKVNLNYIHYCDALKWLKYLTKTMVKITQIHGLHVAGFTQNFQQGLVIESDDSDLSFDSLSDPDDPSVEE